VCGSCRAVFLRRWMLRRHMAGVHGRGAAEARELAELGEYWRVHREMPRHRTRGAER
jgi:hypothetical protein